MKKILGKAGNRLENAVRKLGFVRWLLFPVLFLLAWVCLLFDDED